jgi:hypothetical protein
MAHTLDTLWAYGARYLDDVAAYFRAFLLSLLASVPVQIYLFGGLFWFAVFIVFVLGLAAILAVAILTAVLRSYLFRFAVYITTSAALVWALHSYERTVPRSVGAIGPTTLAALQLTLTLGIFYVLLERSRIGASVRAALNFEQQPTSSPTDVT